MPLNHITLDPAASSYKGSRSPLLLLDGRLYLSAFRKIIRLDVDKETTNLIDMPPVNAQSIDYAQLGIWRGCLRLDSMDLVITTGSCTFGSFKIGQQVVGCPSIIILLKPCFRIFSTIRAHQSVLQGRRVFPRTRMPFFYENGQK